MAFSRQSAAVSVCRRPGVAAWLGSACAASSVPATGLSLRSLRAARDLFHAQRHQPRAGFAGAASFQGARWENILAVRADRCASPFVGVAGR
jgi:hypothetical protein